MPYEYDTSGICIMPADLRASLATRQFSYDLRASSKLSGTRSLVIIVDSALLTIIIFNIWSSSKKIGANTT